MPSLSSSTYDCPEAVPSPSEHGFQRVDRGFRAEPLARGHGSLISVLGVLLSARFPCTLEPTRQVSSHCAKLRGEGESAGGGGLPPGRWSCGLRPGTDSEGTRGWSPVDDVQLVQVLQGVQHLAQHGLQPLGGE